MSAVDRSPIRPRLLKQPPVQQIEMFRPTEMASASSSTGLAGPIQLFEVGLPPGLEAELAPAAVRIVNALQNMNANYTEIGHELLSVKERLTRAQYRSWLSLIGGVSLRTARSIMRAAEHQASDPSTARFGRDQKLTLSHLKGVIRAPRAQMPRAPP
jgi:hypothetical protein